MAKYIAIMYPDSVIRDKNLITVIPMRTAVLEGNIRREPTLAFLDTDTYTRVSRGVKEQGVPKWNWNNVRKPSTLQKKQMVALVLMKVVETALQNHLYQFDQVVYRQLSGGPIGDNFTQLSSQVVIYTFATKYRKKLINLSLYQSTVLLKIYVDDCNQAGKCIPYGTKYHKGRLYIPKVGLKGRRNLGTEPCDENTPGLIQTEADRILETEYTERQRQEWSASVYRQIANDILPSSIRMKEDVPAAHANGKLPLLDKLQMIFYQNERRCASSPC